MRKIILMCILFCMTMACMVTTVEAGRFGGGKSFGMSRSISPSRYSNFGSTTQRSTTSTNRWLGPLAGLAAGGLLASLFMGHGLGAGMMSWLLVGFAIFFIIRLLKGMQSSNRFQAQTMSNNVMPLKAAENNMMGTIAANSSSTFDEPAFLRQAKATFIRLQTAYDNKNLSDIRTFTSPEVFAEIQLQLQERGDASNVTDVLNIHGELADLNITSDDIIASVKFTGKICENNAAPIDIQETWHFQQDKNQIDWKLMGIQQG
jgi:predicted lipid-binding transport protein (Tim44 family)